MGISRDPVKVQKRFHDKLGLPYPLLSDAEGSVCQAYGVYKPKSFMGKKTMGIERTTFIIGSRGRIARVFPKVKVAGHAEAVLEAVKALASGSRPREGSRSP